MARAAPWLPLTLCLGLLAVACNDPAPAVENDLATADPLDLSTSDLARSDDLDTSSPDLTELGLTGLDLTAGIDASELTDLMTPPDLATDDLAIAPDDLRSDDDLTIGAPDLATDDLLATDLASPDLLTFDLTTVDFLTADFLPAADLLTPDLLPGDVVIYHASTSSTLTGAADPGSTNGALADARFNNPVGIALDRTTGILYVTEYDGDRVRTIDGSTVGTLTAQSTAGAWVRGPYALALPTGGGLVVQTDFDKTGTKTLSSGTLWSINLTTGVATPIVESLGRPRGLGALGDGTIGVADRLRATTHVLDLSGPPSLAGLAGATDQSGHVDANGTSARFALPHGIIELPGGDLLVADTGNHCLRRVTRSGDVTTFAGDPAVAATVDGPLADARFVSPRALAIDGAGNIFITDVGAHRVRHILVSGDVCTIAGSGVAGYAEGASDTAQFYGLEGIAVTADGATLYVTDGNAGDAGPYHRVRKITLP